MLTETAVYPGARWSGSDLPVLLYESMTSAMLLFAWRNAISFDVLKQYRDLATMINGGAVTGAKDATGYPLLSQVQRQDESYRAAVNRRMLSERLRYCPLCLECGYHSQLHQVLSVTCCPFHRAPLSDTCHCCMANTPDAEDAARLYRAPYYCDLCGEALCGVPPTMDAILDFRVGFAAVGEALAPYIAWWERVRHSGVRIERMGQGGRTDKKHTWCRKPDFAKAFACKEAPAPEYTQASIYSVDEVVTLDWICRLADRSRSDDWPLWVRADYGQPVYLATLKRLRSWIARAEGWSLQEFDARVASRGLETRRSASTRFLAFLALRSHMEGQFIISGGHDLCSQESAQLSMTLFGNIPRYSYRTARLEWRAIFLALYASWHTRLLSAPQCDLREIWQEASRYQDHIFIQSQFFELHRFDTNLYDRPPAYIAWFEGEVSLLKVHGMPLWPWDRASRSRPGAREGGATRLLPSARYGSNVIARSLLPNCTVVARDGVRD